MEIDNNYTNITSGFPDEPNIPESMYPEDYIRIRFVQIVCPSILLLGTVGNILAVIVLQNKEVRSMPSAPYLTTLAISDIMVLYSSAIHAWLSYGFGIDIRIYSNVICKLRLFFIYAFSHISAWLIIAVTADRFVCIVFPFKAGDIRKKHRLGVIASILIIFFALNGHFLYGKLLVSVPNADGSISYKCGVISHEYSEFYDYVVSWIDYTAYTIVPLVALVFCDIGMVMTLMRSRSTFKEDSTTEAEKPQDSARKLIKLLLTLTISFVVLTSPLCLLQIYYVYWPNIHLESEKAKYDLARAIVIQLYYLNHAINFFLYIVTGARFREGLKAIFGCK